ncbi:MAG TPA: SDR family NAD(P)-dependent oxidoreductase [Kofleriaceae bacterium]|nr:SDR family NAD(P)-dependent oxidoreductase [Kofleriaceae bacterium]
MIDAIAQQLKMRTAEIGRDTQLSEFGFDSIRLMAFAAHLNRRYGLDVSPAVFFEHGTVREVGKYLVGQYASLLGQHLGAAPQQTHTGTAPATPVAPATVARVEPPSSEPIAIIGMSGCFPGARDVDAFWDNLAAGRDCISEVPDSRWDWRAVHGDPIKENGKTNVKWGGFSEGVEEFDSLFFGISPREAQLMDPQQRLLMIHVWQAIEDAGYSPKSLSENRTGIFVGTLASGGYAELIAQANLPIEGYSATGATASIGPNRMSYLLDLDGPSEPVETACSSSLVAIHRAVRAMHSGECEMALVGGVNTIASPTAHISFSRAGMLSVDGRCKTFSKNANGYVRGEGAAILVLKKLSAAERDRDRIYGIIRGSAENHGGRASSLTAPNPKAQAEVIKAAHRQAGIDPRTITYVETHGTGTPLGDPVEINGLKRAFADLYAASREPGSPPSDIAEVHCGLGSVKTNIGHLEIAAGVAGVIKVLLQLQHQTLVKSLHCEEINPFIQLDGSPFYIVQEARPWQALRDRHGRELPRRAGVSSFGFGGVNAHVVIEEYRAAQLERTPEPRLERPALIVLSARNAGQLRERARDLRAHLDREGLRDSDLVDIAYTLQVGRDAMAHRFGFAVRSLEQARDLLRQVLNAAEQRPDAGVAEIHRGEAKKNREAASPAEVGELEAAVDAWLARGEHGKLLALWAGGLEVDWNRLYAGDPSLRPRRVRVPAYPFSSARCWIDASDGPKPNGRHLDSERLHPLLQRNTSTLAQQRFTSTFDGHERFLTDHVVDAGKVLPGVAYLEMARAAVEHAAARREGCLVLTDVLWMRPIVVRDRSEVHIGLSGDEAGPIEVRVYSASRNERDGQAVIHAQARATWAASAPAQLVDLAALKTRCERSIDPGECYAAYRAMKIEYGPAHRGLSGMQLGRDTDGRRFLLAQVSLPSCVRETAADYVLHPSVLDGAFQATIGLSLDLVGSSPMLPFALERLEIVEGTPASAWVYVRPSEAQASASTQKLDLDVLDGGGRVCVRMRGLTARALTNQRPSTARPSPTAPQEGTVMLAPHWEPRALVAGDVWPAPASRVVLIGGAADDQRAWRQDYPDLEVLAPPADASESVLAGLLQRLGSIDHLVWLAPASDPSGLIESLIDAQAAGVIALYRLIKALLSLGYGSRALGLTVATAQTQAVIPGEDIAPAHASVHGLVGSLAKEYASWKIRLLELPTSCGSADSRGRAPAVDAILRVPADDKGNAWAYRAGEWYRQELVPCELAAPEQPAFRQGGLYVVIGGAGGIGEVLSEYLIRRYQAQMVWIGRRELDPEIQAKIDRLAALGPAPLYLRADATNHAALEGACRQIKARHARITGVVHAAIQLLDKSLVQMDEARFRASLAAKVDVGVRLAQVFAHEPLEIVLFFSSLQSFAKAAGQSNYAAGCAFKDALAHRLGRDLACPVKVMNWSYWGSVGIVASEAYRARMAKLGVGSIEPDEAMDALERLVAGPRSQTIFLKQTSPELLPQLGAVEERLTQLGGAARLEIDRVPVRKDRPLAVARWHERMSDMQGLLGRLLLGQLQSLGLFAASSSSIAAWQQEVGMRPIYGRWMEESVRVLESLGLAIETRISVDELWAEWETRKARWLEDPSLRAQAKLVEVALRALPQVLTGKRLATDVLFPSSSMELVEGVYKHNVSADYFNNVLADSLEALLLERIAQGADARIRILEIGAGTGGTSEGVLRRLNLYGRAIVEYCFTDVSKAFLLHAQKEYAPASPYLVTHIFNVEQPLQAQGIEVGAYDIVVAANVLHATKNIRQTLRNTKAALKRGGALVLNELSGNTLAMHLTFGLLEGWWRYEDPALRVTGSPILAPDTWDRMLRSEGFGRVMFPAELAHAYGQAIIVAQSDGVIRQAQAAKPQDLARPAPSPRGAQPAASSPDAGGADRDRLMAVRRTIREAIGRALKIDYDGIQDEVSFSEYGVDSIVGVSLIKEINESFGINLPTTALFDYPTLKSLTKHVTTEHGTALRLLPQMPAAEEVVVAVASTPAIAVESVSAGEATYHRVMVSGPGRIDDLEITQAASPRVGEQEVQIAVEAFSLNFGDLLCVKGLYPTMPPYPFTPGFEISGAVVEVGAAVRSVTRGQRVLALMGEHLGGHATVVTCHESQVTAIPKGLSFEQACALPVVAITMIDAFHKAQIKRGEKILIQTATGGTGLIAVQLAKHHGAEIYATAGSARKVEYLQRLGVAHAINYVAQDFEQEVDRLTNGRGVDVVINTLSGDAIQKGLNCLSSGGRYIEIAMTALKSARSVDLSVLSDNQTFYSVDLRKLARNRPERLAEYRREMLELVERGVITATVSDVVPFDQIQTAYRRLENRENIGKVVVTVPETYRYQRVERPVASAAVPSVVVPTAPGVREPIAIIGMSGRFATADTVEELWDGLAGGVELTDKVTRWELGEHLAGVLGADEKYCERGGLLRQIDRFDAEFFNVSGLEATYMDPHQRLFLEEGWKALEDAGYVGESIEARRCGVYVGCAGGDYASLFDDEAPAQAFWGNAASVISARISYHLNLQGPAITVDTACSSSLVAMHMACQALWSGEIELGLAGGVHVQCTPAFYVLASRAAMLSPQGRCHAFDARANGFVPGEGVGALVLKRLSDAQRDGDHIYGVIRGSGINQDGTTNGITAPSALSQEHLEREVYDTFQIRPDDIRLMEAHGTGTKLGDPIEWRALSNAFRHYTQDNQFCAIGSIKTNIGHTAAAAGVAGIIKILLALKHRQLPPSLHFEHGNPHIDFDDSPFFVNTTLRAWDAFSRRPRAAAVSSFGFSGTNAHMVIEEAPAAERAHADRPGYLIVVSARGAQRLRDQVESLVRHCAATPALDLGNASYTLLIGRKHFDHRLACVVRDPRELCTRLQEWLDNGNAQRVYTGKLNGPGGAESSLEHRGTQCIEACRRGAPAAEYLEHLSTIAELYAQGYGLSFGLLFADDGYSRISLPTARFAPERHWVEAPRAPRDDASKSQHPLLQHNTSDLTELRFSSTLRGAEFYLNDHVVSGRKVFPGVCYLEMARAAVERSAGMKTAPAGVALQDIVWTSPLVVDGATEVHIGLRADGSRAIEFEVYCDAGGDDQARAVHAQGRALLLDAASPARQEWVDLDALRQRVERSIDVAQCYEAFAALGIVYGAAHRALVGVDVGSERDGGRFVLAQVALPACVSETREQFVLHPSVLDGSLQATIGLALDGGAMRSGPQLPFALERLEILHRTPATAWVVVRPAATRHDVVICDEAGRVCVRIEGLSAKAKPRAVEPDATPVLMVPRWEPTELPEGPISPAASAKVVLVGGARAQQQAWRERYPRLQVVELDASVETLAARLAARGEIDHLVWLAPESLPGGMADEALIAAQEADVIGLYRLIKALLVLGYDTRRFELTVVTWQTQAIIPSERADVTHAAVHGLIGSLAKEYEDWKIRLVDGSPADPTFLDNLLRAPADPRGDAWVYRAGEWYRQQLIACELEAPPEAPYRQGGVYVVIGGAGGIGEVFSEHLIRNHGARLVWLGRSAMSAAIEAKIARLAKLGPAPMYLACDASDRDSLEQAYRRIKAEHGQIHGVVHAAIVLLDKSLAQMEEDRFRASLQAKVDVSVRLAQVFAQEALDFVVFFSSLQSFSKAAGQSNYAAGCTFKDAFASRLALEWPSAVKVMNWGYWGSVGVVASETYRARMAQLGVGSIEPAEGMAALEQLLSSPMSQLVLVKTMQPVSQVAEIPEWAPRTAGERPAVAEWSRSAVSEPSYRAEQL